MGLFGLFGMKDKKPETVSGKIEKDNRTGSTDIQKHYQEFLDSNSFMKSYAQKTPLMNTCFLPIDPCRLGFFSNNEYDCIGYVSVCCCNIRYWEALYDCANGELKGEKIDYPQCFIRFKPEDAKAIVKKLKSAEACALESELTDQFLCRTSFPASLGISSSSQLQENCYLSPKIYMTEEKLLAVSLAYEVHDTKELTHTTEERFVYLTETERDTLFHYYKDGFKKFFGKQTFMEMLLAKNYETDRKESELYLKDIIFRKPSGIRTVSYKDTNSESSELKAVTMQIVIPNLPALYTLAFRGQNLKSPEYVTACRKAMGAAKCNFTKFRNCDDLVKNFTEETLLENETNLITTQMKRHIAFYLTVCENGDALLQMTDSNPFSKPVLLHLSGAKQKYLCELLEAKAEKPIQDIVNDAWQKCYEHEIKHLEEIKDPASKAIKQVFDWSHPEDKIFGCNVWYEKI